MSNEALNRMKTGYFGGQYGFDLSLLFNAAGEVGEMLRDGRLVEVVRCKDCKHRYDSLCCPIALISDLLKDTKVFEYKVNGNWFCADGERRADDG